MSKPAIAVIDANPWVYSSLKELLGPGFDVSRVLDFTGDSVGLSEVAALLVGNASDNPVQMAETLRRLKCIQPGAPIILMAWSSSEQLAIAAIKAGVADYFSPPIDMRDVAVAVSRSASSPTTRDKVQKSALPVSTRTIIGESPPMQEVRKQVMHLARRDCNALILGETGTGKDLVAEAIHINSSRQGKPFICVNCAAIPDTLLESELFGYDRGAFTGANRAAEGIIRQGHKGTVFFDEIGEMTPYAQAKILRFIEGKQIQSLGGKTSIPVDVRIIAATNQDLVGLISEHRFRQDLYFRLNVAQIKLPALRERREDIGALLKHYVDFFNRETGAAVEGFAVHAVDHLSAYDWPGNVRELKNLVESIFLDPPYPRIDLCHLRRSSARFSGTAVTSERQQLLEALESTDWNKSKAAGKLRWSRMKIYRKMEKYSIAEREKSGESVASGC